MHFQLRRHVLIRAALSVVLGTAMPACSCAPVAGSAATAHELHEPAAAYVDSRAGYKEIRRRFEQMASNCEPPADIDSTTARPVLTAAASIVPSYMAADGLTFVSYYRRYRTRLPIPLLGSSDSEADPADLMTAELWPWGLVQYNIMQGHVRRLNDKESRGLEGFDQTQWSSREVDYPFISSAKSKAAGRIEVLIPARFVSLTDREMHSIVVGFEFALDPDRSEWVLIGTASYGLPPFLSLPALPV